jgi:RecA-family ATPase
MYLHGIKAAEDEQPDSDLREIEFKKNNYGPKGQSIVLRYQNGLFLPEPGMSSLEKAQRDKRIEEVFLTLLRKLDNQHRPVSPSSSAHNYAPNVFAGMADGKAYNKKDYVEAMERLLDRRVIHVEKYGRPARPQRFLAAGPSPETRS